VDSMDIGRALVNNALQGGSTESSQ
jgi:hypothetical protein